jgi:hypothetical protein
MAMSSPVDRTDVHAPDPQALRLAKLFDLRTFIGALFLIFGVVVTLEGLVASKASIAKAAGINMSLWTGVCMLAVGVVFIVWVLAKPPSLEVKRQDLSHAPGSDVH